ncbi:MAG: hypothetical protein GKS06_08915 [Acidobacteria bacterium]|nr:hypothetical protein [Acidobacteriota bacterium]
MSFHTHHLEKATAKVNRLTERYYTLAYRRLDGDAERVSIEVKVNQEGLKLDAPTRLVLPPEPHEMTPLQLRMYEAERVAAAPTPRR